MISVAVGVIDGAVNHCRQRKGSVASELTVAKYTFRSSIWETHELGTSHLKILKLRKALALLSSDMRYCIENRRLHFSQKLPAVSKEYCPRYFPSGTREVDEVLPRHCGVTMVVVRRNILSATT